MTGKPGAAKSEGVCALCAGPLASQVTTLPFLEGEHVIVIRDVPAEVCEDCGEAYLSGRVVDWIDDLLSRAGDLPLEVSILSYLPTAPGTAQLQEEPRSLLARRNV